MAEHATQAVIGWGTQVQYGDGGDPETFANFHEVTTADPPDEQTDEPEATHFESPSRTKEYVQGMIDSGEFTFELNWLPDVYADHQQLVTDKAAGTRRNYRIVLPGSMETITTPGFVKGLKRSLAPSDVVKMSVTVRCGAVTATSPAIT
jgi:hypothetical protein